MKPQDTPSVILFPLLAAAAAMHAVFLLFSSPRNPVSDHAGMLLWWGCLSLTYGILTLLLRRPRSTRTVILIATCGFLLQLVLTLMVAFRPSTVLSWSVLLFMWISLYARCCIQLLEGTQTDAVVTTFELSVLTLFVIGFGVSMAVITPASLLHCAAGVLLTLVAMIRIRSGHTRVDTRSGHSFKSRFFLIALLAGIGGLAAALCTLLTDSASYLLSRLTHWGFTLLRAAAAQVDRFLRWILSLLPAQHMNSALLEEAEAQAPSGAADWGTLNSQLLFYLMLGVIVLFALIALVWIWRNGGFRRVAFRSRTMTQVSRKHRSLRDLLRQLWQRYQQWFSFQISYLKLRNTAAGLFVWLEQQMRARHLERKTGETARAFLLRIQTTLPSCSEPLSRLADCLDQHYFGAGQSLSISEITAMRRQIRAELHQQLSEKAADA